MLADVAKLAGVSVSTVSRVMSGRTPVSPKLRARVESAVEQLGYRPDPVGRALVSGQRSGVAVLARNTTRYGYAQTLQGIEEAARSASLMVMITVVEGEDDDEIRDAIDMVLSQPLAGVIVIEFDQIGARTLAALPDWVRAVGAAGAPQQGASRPHAYLDDHEAGRVATQHLLNLGHRTVHHVAIPATAPNSGRARGWQQALEDAGARVPDLQQADYSADSGYEAGIELLIDDDVTAILCGNDEVAIGVARALQDRGLEIPNDVSVVGFDDQPFARMWRPALTTVSQDFVGLGRRAFGLLAHWLETGQPPADSRVVPSLVLRESTASP